MPTSPVLLLVSLFALQQEETLKPVSVVPLQGPLHHVQGIDVEDETIWVSSVDAKAGKGYLSRLDLQSGKLLQQVEVQEGQRIHPGGITLDGSFVWVPVAEYDRDGPTSVQKRDKRTLALADKFTVHDHIGCVAATPEILIGGSWDARTLYRWDRSGTELSRESNPHPTRYQDLKFISGRLIGGGLLNREQGAIDWMDPMTYKLLRRIMTGKTDRGVLYTHEGVTIRKGRLYLLPEDDPSRLFIFAAPE